VLNNRGDATRLKPAGVILADVEREALAFIGRLERVVRAGRCPLRSGAAEVLRSAASVFLPGESSEPADRTVRDRIEAVADAAAEVAEAIGRCKRG
jgi:hypothetical protein